MNAQTLLKQWLSSPAHRVVRICLIAIFGLGALWRIPTEQPVNAQSTTIYVRPGGDDDNCNGTADVDYSGSGGPGLNCAVQTIAQGVSLVASGGTVLVAAGTYAENVIINKPLTLQGANPPDGPNPTVVAGTITVTSAGTGTTVRQLQIILGNVTGDEAAISVNASNVMISENLIDGIIGNGTGTIKGIHLYSGALPGITNITVSTNTIQNVANTGMGTDGIMVQGVIADVTLMANTVQTVTSAGWAYGIEIAPTASAPFNPPANVTVQQNAISNISATGYPGVGAIIDAANGTPADASQVTVFDNTFFNLLVPLANKDIAHALNASGNYLGYADAVTLAQVISPTLVGRIDYTPWLANDTDITPGTPGFQGDFSALWVGAHNEQTGAAGRIQEGIDLVTTGGTVNVSAGTYRELITVTKSMTLAGELGVVIQPSENIPDFSSTHGGAIVWVQAPDVTLRDLWIDGNNPTIGDGYDYGGADINALRGIYMSATAYDHLLVENVTLHNLGRGINLYGGQNHVLQNNVAQNLGGPDDGNYGFGILLNGNSSAQISDNAIDLALTAGIFVQNNSSANATTITGNTVNDARIGLGWNMLYGGGSGLFENNTVVGGEMGMQVTSITNGYLEVRDNTFTLPTENDEVGFLVWNTRPQTTLIIDNTINGSDVGVFVEDVDATFDANHVHLQLTGNTIDGANTGIEVASNSIDHSVTLTATNNFISSVGVGVSLTGADPIDHATFAGNRLSDLDTAFDVGTTGELYAFANNIDDFTTGIVDSEAALNARHNWWGTHADADRPNDIDDDSWQYRLGAPVETWGMGMLADATLTNAGGTGTGVIVGHGYGVDRAPFEQSTLPYGDPPCSDYYDFFVLNAAGPWTVRVPLDVSIPGCVADEQVLYHFALTGGGWPDTSCSDADCWLTSPGITRDGDYLEATVDAGTFLQGTPFVAGGGMANLVVSKTDFRTAVRPGETLAYLITITNTGNVPATVSVTDTLPENSAFLIASDNGTEITTRVVTWPTFILPGNGARTTRLVVATLGNTFLTGVDTITNTVTATAPNEADETDNTAWDIDQINAAPDLTLSKSDGGALAIPDQTLVYTLFYTNTGNQGATGVVITETIPAYTTFDAASSDANWSCVGDAPAGTICTYAVNDLAINGSGSVAFALHILTPLPFTVTEIANTATIADDGSNGADPTPANNTATTATAIDAAPVLAISKSNDVDTVTPGDTLTYQIVVTNTGDQEAASVVVTDYLPAHTTFDSASDGGGLSASGVVAWPAFALEGGGASTVLSLVVGVPNPFPADSDSITNTATVANEGILYATAEDVDAVNAAPILALSKDNGMTTVTPGSTLIYRLVITNSGNQLTNGIVLTDTLPDFTIFTLASDNGQETIPGSGIVVWPAFDVPGGGTSVTRLLVVTVDNPLDAGVTTITNRAELRDNQGHPANAEDTDAVNANPNFVLTKTNAVTTTTPGATLNYAITITNTGNQGATGVVITDTLPADVTFGTASDGGAETSPGSGIVVWGPFALASGASATRYLTVDVNATLPAGLELLINAVDAGDDRGFTATNQHADFVEAAPDLVIGKTDGGLSAHPGETHVYTLTYTNQGDQDATGVFIVETVPAHTTFDATGNPGWSCADGAPAGTPCTYAIGDLPASASDIVTFSVRVVQPLPANTTQTANTATIADDRSSGEDSDPNNNTTTITTAIIAAPELVVSKDDGRATAQPGDTLSYVITVTNAGDQNAASVFVTDTLPLHTVFVVASDGGAITEPGVVTWPAFSLAGDGASATRLVVVSVINPLPAGVDAITNTITAATANELNLDDNTAWDIDTILAAPDLALSKRAAAVSVEPGDTLAYTLTYANLGNQEATSVVITETVPAYTTFDPAASHPDWSCAGSICTHDAGSLPAGVTRDITFTVNVTDALPAGVTQIVNTAGISDDGADVNPANNAAGTVTPVSAAPDLTLTKSDGGVTTTPGATLVYTLTYANTGNQEAAGVVIAETVPANTAFAGPTGWNCVGTNCEYALGALPAGASGDITFTVAIINPLPAGVTQINNTAAIADDGANGADPTPADNTATTITPVEAKPDLEISKSDGVSAVNPGDILTYQIAITNTGDQNSTGVRVTDYLPAHTIFVSASADGDQTMPGIVTWPEFALAGGASVTRSVTVEVPDPFPADTNLITNTVSVTDDGTNGLDPTPENNTATDVDTLSAAAILLMIKDDGIITVTPGSTLVYSLIISNTGSQLATGIRLTDTLPANTTFSIASDGGSQTAPGVVTWPAFNLPGRTSTTRLLVVTLDNPLPAGVTTITNTAALSDNQGHSLQAEDVDWVDANPLLALTKTNAVESVTPGTTLAYTLTLTNNGNQEATGVLITDTLPANVTFVTASDGGYTITEGIVAWPAFNLAGGSGSVTRQLIVAVNPTLPAGVEILVNTARAIEDRGYSATAQHADLVVAAPDLAIAKTDGGIVPRPGAVLPYTLTYTNAGNQGATGVAIAETVPAYTTFDAAASSTGWTCADGALAGTSCAYTVGSLPAGGSAAVFFAVRVVSPLPVYVRDTANTASITDDGSNGADANPADNSANIVTPFGATVDLFITKDDGDITVEPGETIVYTLTYANNGDQIAGGVIVTETVPALTTFNQITSSTGWTCAHGAPAGTTCTYALGDVIAGGTVRFAVDVVLPFPLNVSEITNQAVIGADANTIPDAHPVNNTATATTPVITRPDLVAGKDDGFSVVLPDQQFTYIITVTNVGTQNATNVRITDTLPVYVTFAGASDGGTQSQPGVVTWPAIAQLELDQVVTRTVRVMLDSALPAGVSHITNTVAVGDDGTHGLDLNPADNIAIDVNFVGAMPDLVLDKTVDRAVTYPKGFLIYTIRVENTGSQGATGVSIVDTLPANTIFVSASDGGYTSTPGVVTWPAFALNVGEQAVRTLAVQTASGLPEGYVLTNAAAVSDDGTNGEDPTPSNNMDTASTTIEWPVIYLPLILRNFAVGPDLIVENVVIGNGTIAITIKNQGKVVVTDTLGFWVDLYINPSPAPTHVNQTWDPISPYGAAWGVDREALPIQPGESRTLYLYDIYYKRDYSRLPSALRAGDILYVQVDSYNAATTYGVVLEDHEMSGTPYNNIVRLIVDTYSPLNPVAGMGAPVSPGADILPERP